MGVARVQVWLVRVVVGMWMVVPTLSMSLGVAVVVVVGVVLVAMGWAL